MNADERKYFSMAGSIIALSIVLCMCGCVPSKRATQGAANPSLDLQFYREFEQVLDTGENLLLVIAAYRAGAGRWPQSPEDLRPATEGLIDWDRFENLTFESRSDGGFEIAFDRWTSRDGTVVFHNTKLVWDDSIQEQE